MASVSLDPKSLLTAYMHGAFPMADEKGQVEWYTADPRGVLPLDTFHIPKTLAAKVRQRLFEIRYNTVFEQVIRACQIERSSETWISESIIQAYVKLHELGHAHSVEAWEGQTLVGGLYGVSIGAAFFGESMFHRVKDASKIALVHLVRRLRERDFELLDTQAATTHLKRFGCIEMPADEYLKRLHKAILKPRSFMQA